MSQLAGQTVPNMMVCKSLSALRLGQQYDASWLERLGGRVDGRRVLEVGCGRGVGVQIILERFAPLRWKRSILHTVRDGSSSYPFDGTPQAFRLLISTQTLTLAGRSQLVSRRAFQLAIRAC